MIFKRCPHCNRIKLARTIRRRRMHTRYSDEESNYLTSCQTCFDASEEFWEEMWRDYYSGLI